MKYFNVDITFKRKNTKEEVNETIQLLSIPEVGHLITLKDETVIEVREVSHTVADQPIITLTCKDKSDKTRKPMSVAK